MLDKFLLAIGFILDVLISDGAMNKAFICVVLAFVLSYLELDIQENLIATSGVILLFVVAMELAGNWLWGWRNKKIGKKI